MFNDDFYKDALTNKIIYDAEQAATKKKSKKTKKLKYKD